MLSSERYSGGDSETQMTIIHKVFKDCVETMEHGKGKEGAEKIITFIKNFMSDRCVVHENINSLFKQYCEDIISTVV